MGPTRDLLQASEGRVNPCLFQHLRFNCVKPFAEANEIQAQLR